MFGRSSHPSSAPAPQPSLRLQVMPEEFYGGKDPVVHYAKEDIVIEHKKVLQTPTKTPVPSDDTLAKPKRKMWLIVAGSVVFLLAVAGISWYYISQAQQNVQEPVDQEPSSDVILPAPPIDEPVIEPTVTSTLSEQEQVPTTTPSLSVSIDFPRKIFTDSGDLDADSLTDTEEEIFGTDTGVYDTDSDGYYDGLEIINLYNPRGIAPMKLIDSGLVSEYVHPVSQYRVYYPSNWESAPVDPNANQVLFSAITGDYVEIFFSQKLNGETFVDWFGRVATGQSFTDLTKVRNRFGIDMYQRDDTTVSFYETDSAVFVLLYHPIGSGAVPFRQAVRMMQESFRPTRVFTELPVQETLPTPSGSDTVEVLL